MSGKSIYGDSATNTLTCNPQSALVPSLMTQMASLLANLDGTNKATTIAQLDNIRQQLMYIGGVGDSYTPYAPSTRSRGIKANTSGKLEVVGVDRSLQSTVK